MNTSLDLTVFVQYGLNAADRHMQARKAGLALFNSMHSRARRAKVLGRLMGRSSGLQTLDHSRSLATKKQAGIVNVPLNEIDGTEGRSEDFDAEFRPLKAHDRERWAGVAAARMLGVALPPIELVQHGDRYFVRDGHHRISVAKALGQVEIEARIVN